MLAEPVEVLDGTPLSRIELIPPVHQRVYRMGLEHLGVVVGEDFDDFLRMHRAVLTGQQFQSPTVDPLYILFEDFTNVKFYRRSFFDVVADEGGRFDDFRHVDDWVPQRLVTATGPNRCRGDLGCGRRSRHGVTVVRLTLLMLVVFGLVITTVVVDQIVTGGTQGAGLPPTAHLTFGPGIHEFTKSDIRDIAAFV